MGVDLRLLPYDADGAVVFSHTVLSCGRNYDLFDRIAEIEQMRGRDVVDEFSSFVSRQVIEDTAYGKTTETPYGERVKEVEVEDLLSLRDGLTTDWRNQAVWAYLDKLPPRTKVALFWH